MNLVPKTILVGTDFGEASDRALDHAVALAQATNARIVLLHACPVEAFGFPEGPPATRDLLNEMQGAARSALDEVIARRQTARVPIEARVELGDARDALVAAAGQIHADLVVMGTHGRRGVRRALLGSVAESVTRTAPCPVLTVRAEHL